jgi:hypothetical protein
MQEKSAFGRHPAVRWDGVAGALATASRVAATSRALARRRIDAARAMRMT